MQKSVTYQDNTVYYAINGTGMPLLLIHGFAEDATIWDTWSVPLTQKNTVYTIHLPGTGWSKDCKASICNLQDCAAIIIQISEVENLSNLHIVGHSMGGYIALLLLQHMPQTIKLLTLLHSSIYEDTEAKKEARDKNIRFIEEHGVALFLMQTIPNLFAPSYVIKYKQKVTELAQNMSYMKGDILIAYTEAMKNRRSSEIIVSNTTIPIRFIIGAEDQIVPYAIGLKQSIVPKNSYIHILNGVGHMCMLESERLEDLI